MCERVDGCNCYLSNVSVCVDESVTERWLVMCGYDVHGVILLGEENKSAVMECFALLKVKKSLHSVSLHL